MVEKCCDGDEANIFVPQSYKAKTNVLANMMPQNCMLSEQTHKVMVGVVQDALMGAYFLTSANVYVGDNMFGDIASYTFKYFERSFPAKTRAPDLSSHILDVFKRSEKEGNVKFSGRTLFSIVFPPDFYFLTMDKDDKVEVRNGILVSGQMNAGILYKSHNSLIQAYTRRYGTYLAAELVGNISRMCQNYLSRRGFSVGISDCLANPQQEYSIKQKTVEALQKAKELSEMIVPDPILAAVKENRILSTLNENQKVEQSNIIFKPGVVHKIKPNAKVSLVYIHETKTFTNENKTSQLEIHRKKNKVILFNNKTNTFTLEGLSTITVDDGTETTVIPLETVENAFSSALGAAAKGEAMQLGQIYGPLGQATFSGRRIPLTMANNTRVLPHFPQNSNDPMATGFTLNSYISGMNPVELYMNFIQAREPQTDTTIKTARTGYVQRKLVKYMQDLIIQEDHSVRNDQKRIVQFEYGKLGCSVDKMVEVDGESQFTNVVQRYNEVKLIKHHKNAYIFFSNDVKSLLACGYQFYDQKSRFNVPWLQNLDDKTRREINAIVRDIKSYKDISDKDFNFLMERALRFEKDESKEWVEQNLLTLFLFYELDKLLAMKEVRELYLELKMKNQLQVSYAFTILSFVLKELVCFVDIQTSQAEVNQLEQLFDFVIVGGSMSDLTSMPYTRMVVFDNVDIVMTGGSDSFILDLPSGKVVDDVKGKVLPFEIIIDNKVSDKSIKLNKETPFKPKDLNQETEKKWKILQRNSDKVVKAELK